MSEQSVLFPKAHKEVVISMLENYEKETNDRMQKTIDAITKKKEELEIISGQHVGPTSWNGFGTKGRWLVAEYLGIDLAKDFSVDADYLDKKTKAEIIAFGKKSEILKDPKVKARLKGADPAKLKKSELVDVILKSGVELIGKVPAEILKESRR